MARSNKKIFSSQIGKWEAELQYRNDRNGDVKLGLFDTEADATEACNKKAKESFRTK